MIGTCSAPSAFDERHQRTMSALLPIGVGKPQRNGPEKVRASRWIAPRAPHKRGRLPTLSVDASPREATLWLRAESRLAAQPPQGRLQNREWRSPTSPRAGSWSPTSASKPNASIVWQPIRNLLQRVASGRLHCGNKWWRFETERAKDGMAVIGGWMRRRLIFSRYRVGVDGN
jgi:hypothetical protein